MENFVVSARKYRPVTFESVVGQSHITTTLKNALKSDQLAQAFLFCGPRGVGKTTCARILAKTINCLSLTSDYEACGKCESCQAFQKNGAMNIFELDAASNNSVDDIRNLVDQVRYPPQSGKKKIYIIDEVHMLSTSAFNAFLKTLEEPPPYVIFILATTEKHKIIPTILSRCQIFDFKRIEAKDISDHLSGIAKKENVQAEQDALELIAQKADGGLRDALSLFDMLAAFGGKEGITYVSALENLHILDYDYYFRMTDALLKQDMAEAYLIFDEILKKGFDGHTFIAGLGKHFRDLMVSKDSSTLELMEVSERVKKKYQEQALKASVSFLLSGLNISMQADLNYKSSKMPRLLVELALSKMSHLLSLIDVAGLQTEQTTVESTEKKKPENQSLKELQPQKEFQQVDVKEDSKKNTLSIPRLNDLDLSDDYSITSQHIPNQPIDKIELLKVVDLFRKTLKEEASQKAFNKKIDIVENSKVVIEVDEEKFLEYITLEKERFIKFLRNKLKNEQIECEAVWVQPEVKPRLYTNFDKYNYLKENNENFNLLIEKLGLEPEH